MVFKIIYKAFQEDHRMKHAFLILTALLFSTGIVCAETSIKTEVKVATPTIHAGVEQGKGVVTDPPEKAYVDGQLYYNAIPSGPAQAGTAVKVIDSKDDIDYISRVYELKTPLVAAEIASYLRTTLDKERGKVDVSVNLETGVRYLIVTAPIFQFPGIEETIQRLDSPGTRFYEDGTKNTAYKMRHRLASEVAELMDRVLISKDGKVYADNSVNTIYYEDSPSYLKGALHYVEQFDVPVEMVRIDVAVVEIERVRNYNIGIDFSVIPEVLPENVDMTIDWSAQKGNPGGGPSGWARYVAQNVQVSGMRPKALMAMVNLWIVNGKGKVLTSPTVVALNGQTSTIETIDHINYKAYSTPQDPIAKTAQSGIILNMVPVIGLDTISLKIDVIMNSVVGWTQGGAPIINTRSSDSYAVLKDGELFVLAGLQMDNKLQKEVRIPFLGAIPFFGYLFRHEIDIDEKSDVLIFLKPRKVTPRTGVLAEEQRLLDETRSYLDEPRPGKLNEFYEKFILNKPPTEQPWRTE